MNSKSTAVEVARPKRLWQAIRASVGTRRPNHNESPTLMSTRHQFGDIEGFDRAEREHLGLTKTAWEILERDEAGCTVAGGEPDPLSLDDDQALTASISVTPVDRR